MDPSKWTVDNSFDAFVEQSSAHLLSYLRTVVRDSDGVDAEDALQEGLIRVAREWDDLPEDPATRKNHIYRALRCSAVDAMRKWSGRGSARGRTRSADLELAETIGHLDDPNPVRDAELASIGRAIYRDAVGRDEAEQTILRTVLVTALAALKPLEAQVIFGLAGHASREELARDLNIDTTRVRNVAQEARDVLRPLILHASGVSLSPVERERLFRYLDGELRGRERRLVKRHVAHCDTCRAIAAFERDVAQAGARLVLPLPALGGAAQGAAAAVAGSAAATGAAVVAGTGGTGIGGVFAGAAAKIAAGLATAVVLGAGGAAVVEHRIAKRPHPPVEGASTARSAAPTAIPVAVTAQTRPAGGLQAQPRARVPERRREATPRARAHRAHSSPRLKSAQASGPVVRAAASQQQASAPSRSGTGGEFVIGGG